MQLRDILRSQSMTSVATRAATAYLRFALHTTRWRLDCSPADLRRLTTEPVILAFWHERLLLMPIVWRLIRRAGGSPDRYPKVNVLISRHHDGRMIAGVMARFGAQIVHGSSAREKDGTITDRGGAAALRRLAALLRAGEHVVITPDGPRGPPRMAKLGLDHLARVTGRPILPCAAWSAPHLRLPTWDRMMVPLPFGRGVLSLGPPISSPRAQTPRLEAYLDDVARRADARW